MISGYDVLSWISAKVCTIQKGTYHHREYYNYTTTYSFATESTTFISMVATKKYFTNRGTPVLSILIAGGLVTKTITEFPGSGYLVTTN